MKRLILLALLFINLFALDNKKIILQNKTPFKLQIIIGYYDGKDWISKGWFNIKSNKDLVFYTKGNIFYYRAKSYYGNFNWYPSKNESYVKLYVIDKAFEINSSNPPSNARIEKFRVRKIPNNLKSYTYNLTYTQNNINFVKPQDCVCHDDYISLKNSINPSRKAVDTSTAKTLANALSTLPTTDYCSKQAGSIIYMESQIYSLIAESKDKCGDGFVEGFMTGFFEPWKIFTTCPDIEDKNKKLYKKWNQQVNLYDEWYQGNCSK